MITGKIVKVINSYKFVVNLGSSNSDIVQGQRFKVINIGEEILDPETGDSLGKLEIPLGIAEVIHVQDTISTLQSCDYIATEPRREITITTKGDAFSGGALSGFAKALSSMSDKKETVEKVIPQPPQLKSINAEQGDIVVSLNR